MGNSVCDSKKLYDTEFEAQRAAAISEHQFGEEFTYYKCNQHYHLTHADRNRRGSKRTKQLLCQNCNEYIERGRELTHLKYCNLRK